MTAVHYGSYTEARTHLKDLLDAAARGDVATVRRDTETTAVVDAERLRYALVHLCPSRAEVVAENDGWSIMLPDLPIATDGATFEEALEDMIDALREYAEDWQNGLREAVNHKNNWGVVQLVGLSTDSQLREWLVGVDQ